VVAGAQPAAEALNVATIPTSTGSEAGFAQDLGFFTKAGLAVNLSILPNGAAIVPAVSSGSVDVGFASIIALAQALARGLPVTILFPAAVYNAKSPSIGLLVTKDAPIATARDLNDKTIATPQLGSHLQIGAMAWVDQNGGQSKGIRWLEVPLLSLQPALDEHRVDAVVAAEPFLSAALPQERVLSYPLSSLGGRFPSAAWFAMKPWADAHRELVTRFVTAMKQTARWANTHARERLPVISKYTKISEESLARTKLDEYGETLVANELRPMLAAAVKYGALARPVTAEELVYR
jgi:NitT/TauT family transport system substrate-binding protein